MMFNLAISPHNEKIQERVNLVNKLRCWLKIDRVFVCKIPLNLHNQRLFNRYSALFLHLWAGYH